jgi:branched-chain amino acid transport system ATP-binding protein
MLDVHSLVMRFGGIRAVDGVSFRVPRGRTLGIVGPNGAGKTVLLNCINGVYKIESGRVTLGGERIDRLQPHAIASRHVGRTFQSTQQFSEFRVVDYVMLGRLSHQSRSIVACALSLPNVRKLERTELEIAEGILAELGLSEVGHHLLSDLPYGIQKQVDMARAIATKPDLLLLDEPTSGTTTGERVGIAAAVDRLAASGLTMVIVDHDVTFISQRCDSLLVMNYGKVLASGDPNEVLARREVIEAYLGG